MMSEQQAAQYEAALARGQHDAIRQWETEGGMDSPYNPRESSDAYIEGYDMARDYQEMLWVETEWGKEFFRS